MREKGSNAKRRAVEPLSQERRHLKGLGLLIPIPSQCGFYWVVDEAIAAGGEDAAAGSGEGASASVITVRVLVAVRPVGSVAT